MRSWELKAKLLLCILPFVFCNKQQSTPPCTCILCNSKVQKFSNALMELFLSPKMQKRTTENTIDNATTKENGSASLEKQITNSTTTTNTTTTTKSSPNKENSTSRLKRRSGNKRGSKEVKMTASSTAVDTGEADSQGQPQHPVLQQQEPTRFTVAIMGGGATGKSSLITRLLRDEFKEEDVSDPTLFDEYELNFVHGRRKCKKFLDPAPPPPK